METGSFIDGWGTFGNQLKDTLFEAINARITQGSEAAREKLVAGFLATEEGQKIQQEGIMQTTQQYWPIVAIALAAVFLLGMFARR